MASLDSKELVEWEIFYRLEAEDRKRASLAAKAESGVINRKRRR